MVCTHEEGTSCADCEIDLSQETADVKCICGSGSRPKSLMTCTGCSKIWHSGCVGLSGLTKSITDKIESWKCPLCFVFSAQIKTKLGEDNVEVSSETVVDSEIDETNRMAMHKDIIEIKNILLKNVIPKTVETTKKVEKVLDANWRRQTQTMADVVQNQKSIERKISNQQSIGLVVNEAVDTSRQKMERDNAERKLRECNCVIQSLPESTSSSNYDKKREDTDTVVEIMNVDPEYIVNVRRAGPPRQNQRRPVIITMSSPELAAELHNHGRGSKRVNNANPDEAYWINPDLIKTDRIANYQARKEAQKRRADVQRRREDRHRQRHHSRSAGTDSPQHATQHRRGSFLHDTRRRDSFQASPTHNGSPQRSATPVRQSSPQNSPYGTPQSSQSRNGDF